MVIWQLGDGRRGHERQSEGLIAALARRVAVQHEYLRVGGRSCSDVLAALSARLPYGHALPPPALVVGAGRRSHWPLLAVARATRARSVCLMRPSLPWRWFDLCVIPAHDEPRDAANVVVSDGPLNPVRPGVKQDRLGVVLLGGPSRHHAWDDHQLIDQVRTLISARAGREWQVTDSRRTPDRCRALLRADDVIAPCYRPHDEVSSDWLPATLAAAREAWVSADSMAMIYEALSAGADVGVLELAARRHDRITRHVDTLIGTGRVATLTTPAHAPGAVLAEADRVAGIVLERWPQLAGDTGMPA